MILIDCFRGGNEEGIWDDMRPGSTTDWGIVG